MPTNDILSEYRKVFELSRWQEGSLSIEIIIRWRQGKTVLFQNDLSPPQQRKCYVKANHIATSEINGWIFVNYCIHTCIYSK
jgi:hypothetical protein